MKNFSYFLNVPQLSLPNKSKLIDWAFRNTTRPNLIQNPNQQSMEHGHLWVRWTMVKQEPIPGYFQRLQVTEAKRWSRREKRRHFPTIIFVGINVLLTTSNSQIQINGFKLKLKIQINLSQNHESHLLIRTKINPNLSNPNRVQQKRNRQYHYEMIDRWARCRHFSTI